MDFKLDIIGIGFPKCGTSWLSSMMDAHPEINMAKVKETFYFIQDANLFRNDITGFRRVHSMNDLENQFDDKMSWENYGNSEGCWSIDHITPQSKLPYDSYNHPNFMKCWSLENLRPLNHIENVKKSNKIIDLDCP